MPDLFVNMIFRCYRAIVLWSHSEQPKVEVNTKLLLKLHTAQKTILNALCSQITLEEDLTLLHGAIKWTFLIWLYKLCEKKIPKIISNKQRDFSSVWTYALRGQVLQVKGVEVFTAENQPVAYTASPEELVCDISFSPALFLSLWIDF